MGKLRQITIMMLFLVCLLGSASVRKDTEAAADTQLKSEGWRIQEECSQLTEQMAEEIYTKVLTLRQKLTKGRCTLENGKMVFLTEEIKERIATVRAVFEADETIVRKPCDDPLILGMYEAKEQLATDEAKKEAEACINGWLAELEPEYLKTYRLVLEVVVKFDITDKNYSLYYPVQEEAKETLEPFERYASEHWKENGQERRQMGCERIFEIRQR